jgi:folate-binding protein YgfZ
MPISKLNDHSLIKISGPDASKFLQGQLTCDVSKITPEQSSLGAHCNVKGRVMSLFRLFLFQADYYLLMPSAVTEAALASLKKYAMFSKVKLTLPTADIYGLQQASLALTYPAQHEAVSATDASCCIRIAGEQRFLLIDFADTLALEHNDDINAWHTADISNGLPRLYPETIGEFLPHYINLPQLGALSFTKGCYTGQEIIARMEHRGKIKQKMNFCQLPIDATPGEKIIFQATAIGRCVDALGQKQLIIQKIDTPSG